VKLEFSGQIFVKYSNKQFHENPSIGRRVVSCGRTDGRTDRQTDKHDEAKRCFPKFCESVQNVQIAKWTQHLLRMQGTRNPKIVHE